MIKLKHNIVRFLHFQAVYGFHVHDFSNSIVLYPVIGDFDSQNISNAFIFFFTPFCMQLFPQALLIVLKIIFPEVRILFDLLQIPMVWIQNFKVGLSFH